MEYISKLIEEFTEEKEKNRKTYNFNGDNKNRKLDV